MNLQSQSKLLGHFAVFLSSERCARFDESTAITREDEETGQKRKNSVGWKCECEFVRNTLFTLGL